MINMKKIVKNTTVVALSGVMAIGMLSGCGTSVDTEKSKNDSRKAVEQTTQAEADTNSKTQNEEDKSESRDIFAMDTYMTLTAYGKNAKKALDEAVDEINNIEQLVSTGIDSSEVSQINKNGKGSVSETRFMTARMECLTLRFTRLCRRGGSRRRTIVFPERKS